MKNTGI